MEPALQQFIYDLASDLRYNCFSSLDRERMIEAAVWRLQNQWMQLGTMRNCLRVLREVSLWTTTANPNYRRIAELNRHC